MTTPTGSGPAPSLPLDPAAMARWGIDYHAEGGVLRLAPQVVREERVSRCAPFRAGRTVVALEFRRRPSSLVLRVEITFGPPLRVEASLPDLPPDTPVLIDDVPVAGPRVAFEARATHEVAWLSG